MLVPKHKRKKLGLETVDIVFLDYAKNNHAYKFLVIKFEISGLDVNTILELRDATFFKDAFLVKIGSSQQLSSESLPSTFGSIPDQVDMMTNVGV